MTPENIRLLRLRAVYKTKNRFHLHDQIGSMLRGALGTCLHEIAPATYQMIFDDRDSATVRPYRLRLTRKHHVELGPGECFDVGIDLYGHGTDHWPFMVQALHLIGDQGLGTQRESVQLAAITQILPSHETVLIKKPKVGLLEDWMSPLPVQGLEFLSPTATRSNGRTSEPTPLSIATGLILRLSQYDAILPMPARELNGTWISLVQNQFTRESRRSGRRQVNGVTGLYWLNRTDEEWSRLLQLACLLGIGGSLAFGCGEAKPLFLDRP